MGACRKTGEDDSSAGFVYKIFWRGSDFDLAIAAEVVDESLDDGLIEV
jgi:hypothetical protein